MYHIYTFGKRSKQFLVMTPAEAQTMNDFTECFFRSQAAYKDRTGQQWDPTKDPTLLFLVPKDDPELLERYDKLARRLNKQHAIRNRLFDLFRIDVRDEEMDDFLIKRI